RPAEEASAPTPGPVGTPLSGTVPLPAAPRLRHRTLPPIRKPQRKDRWAEGRARGSAARTRSRGSQREKPLANRRPGALHSAPTSACCSANQGRLISIIHLGQKLGGPLSPCIELVSRESAPPRLTCPFPSPRLPGGTTELVVRLHQIRTDRDSALEKA